jgi:hypothetical protein
LFGKSNYGVEIGPEDSHNIHHRDDVKNRINLIAFLVEELNPSVSPPRIPKFDGKRSECFGVSCDTLEAD